MMSSSQDRPRPRWAVGVFDGGAPDRVRARKPVSVVRTRRCNRNRVSAAAEQLSLVSDDISARFTADRAFIVYHTRIITKKNSIEIDETKLFCASL